MGLIRFSIIIICTMIVFSCQKERDRKALEKLEKILPGQWHIVSYNMPKYGLGIYYKGTTIYQDTVLRDVGMLEIPTFIAEHVELNHQNSTVPFTLIIDEEEFIHEINYLLPRDFGAFVALRPRYNNPVSEIEKFVSSSNLLLINANLFIENDNRIILLSPFETAKDSMILERVR